jgi:hypothetical protein
MPLLALPKSWFEIPDRVVRAHQKRYPYWLYPVLLWLSYLIYPNWNAVIFLWSYHWLFLLIFTSILRRDSVILVFEPLSVVLEVTYGWNLLGWGMTSLSLYSLLLVAIAYFIPDGGILELRTWSWWRHFWSTWLNHRIFHLPPHSPDPAPTIYACYPHGVATLGLLGTFAAPGVPYAGNEWLYKTVVAATPSILNIPLLGLILKAGGAVGCDRRSLERQLKEGRSVAIIPDGIPGQLACGRDLDRLDLVLEREGFLRLAWEKKYPLRPVFIAGEHAQAWRSGGPWLQWIHDWSAKNLHFIMFLLVGLFPGHASRGPVTPHLGRHVSPQNFNDFDSFKHEFKRQLARLLKEYQVEEKGLVSRRVADFVEKYTK